MLTGYCGDVNCVEDCRECGYIRRFFDFVDDPEMEMMGYETMADEPEEASNDHS